MESIMKEFISHFCDEYDYLYDNDDRVDGFTKAVEAFDYYIENSEHFQSFVAYFNEMRHDFISSDREAAAFIFAFGKHPRAFILYLPEMSK